MVSAACELELVGGLVGEHGGDVADEQWSTTTPVETNNGLNPSWAAEPSRVDVWGPGLTFLKVSVYSCKASALGGLVTSSRKLLAHEAVPVSALRPGYRSLQLRSPASGSLIESCAVLLHIGVEALPAGAVPPAGKAGAGTPLARPRDTRLTHAGTASTLGPSCRAPSLDDDPREAAARPPAANLPKYMRVLGEESGRAGYAAQRRPARRAPQAM